MTIQNKLKARIHSVLGKVAPSAPKTWREKGVELENASCYSEARSVYAARLKEHPSDWPFVCERARFMAQNSLWLEAESLLALLGDAGNTPEILNLRGDVLEKIYFSHIREPWAIPRLEEAFACWRKSLDLNPDQMPVCLHFGCMLQATGQIHEARDLFSRYAGLQAVQAQERQLERLNLTFISCIKHGIGHITLLDYYVKMRELGLVTERRTIVPLRRWRPAPLLFEPR